MVKYCKYCKTLHDENELCERYKNDLKKHPEWVKEVTDLTVASGTTALIQTQALEPVCNAVNSILKTNLTFEGTNQLVRDIQVFAKLNSDSFSKCGIFSDPQKIQSVYNSSSDGFKRYVNCRLNGTGQEIDWLRSQKGIKNLIYKAELPDGNTVGYDGLTANRFTGKVQEISIKAAQGKSGLHTNANDLVEALKKGTLNPKGEAFVTTGTKEQFNNIIDKSITEAKATGNKDLVKTLTEAKNNLKITENGTTESVQKSTKRLTEKMVNGKATPKITANEVLGKAASGAIIGAAVAVTVSSITNYIRYKNGEISKEEVFREVGEDTLKGALVGGATGAVSVFLGALGGPVAFVGGVAVGVYLNAVCTNLLDEIFGKGFYEELLTAEGCILGATRNFGEMLKEFESNVLETQKNIEASDILINKIEQNEEEIKKERIKLDKMLEDL